MSTKLPVSTELGYAHFMDKDSTSDSVSGVCECGLADIEASSELRAESIGSDQADGFHSSPDTTVDRPRPMRAQWDVTGALLRLQARATATPTPEPKD